MLGFNPKPSLVSEPPAMVHDPAAFADEEEKVVPPSPIIDQVCARTAHFHLLPGDSFLPVINAEKSRHLPIVLNRIRSAETSGNLFISVRRMTERFAQLV